MDPIREKAVEFTRTLYAMIKDTLYDIPKITTITVGVKVKHEFPHINLEALCDAVQNPSVLIKSLMDEVIGGDLHYDPNKKSFNNSVIFKLPRSSDKKQQAIKVFCNGTLHITGFKRVEDAIEVGDIFATLMELAFGGTFKIDTFQVQLINTCFHHPSISSNHMIDLASLHQQLICHTEYYTTFNTDRYAGVIVKAPSYNVLLFESGNVILTALSTPEQLKDAFCFIDGFITKHHRSFVKLKQHPNSYAPKPSFDYSQYIVLK